MCYGILSILKIKSENKSGNGSGMANLDLNLLVIFDAIMQEQSITAAAQRLSMTQPSVSNAVSRMRHAWGDPLFVKMGRGIRPTPYAAQLWRETGEALHTIRGATVKERFNIQHTKRVFRIALTDWMADIFWLPLRKIIEQQAPGIDIHAVPYSVNGEQLLLSAEVDMVLDYYAGSSAHIHSQWLFDNHFVCAMRPDHPLAKKQLGLNEYAQAQHLLFSLSGDASGSVDTMLKQHNLSRRVAMTVNHCYNLVNLLENTELITTIPLPIIMDSVRQGKIFVTAPPIDIPPGPISMSWHKRHHRDEASLWLREQVMHILQNDLTNSLPTSHFH